VRAYRKARLGEVTVRGDSPSPATLDREIELLKRILNHAVSEKLLLSNPIADVELLRPNNVREVVLDEADFARLLEVSPPYLKHFFIVAFDTGLRLNTILGLRSNRIDFRNQCIRLPPADMKGKKQGATAY